MLPFRLSNPNERWNVATWGVFLTLYVFYATLFFLLTGCFQPWLSLLGFGFSATTDAFLRGGPRLSAIVWFINWSIFAIPLFLFLLPSLGTLLVLIKLTEDEEEEQPDPENS